MMPTQISDRTLQPTALEYRLRRVIVAEIGNWRFIYIPFVRWEVHVLAQRIHPDIRQGTGNGQTDLIEPGAFVLNLLLRIDEHQTGRRRAARNSQP